MKYFLFPHDFESTYNYNRCSLIHEIFSQRQNWNVLFWLTLVMVVAQKDLLYNDGKEHALFEDLKVCMLIVRNYADEEIYILDISRKDIHSL